MLDMRNEGIGEVILPSSTPCDGEDHCNLVRYTKSLTRIGKAGVIRKLSCRNNILVFNYEFHVEHGQQPANRAGRAAVDADARVASELAMDDVLPTGSECQLVLGIADKEKSAYQSHHS